MRVEIKERRLEFDGFGKVERAVLRYERFAGGMTTELTRHRYFRGDAVAVLVYDPATQRVVLQRQFRYAAHARTGDGWLTECVAGMMEEGETPLEVAQRELLEETGLRLKQAELVAHYFIGPGGCSDRVYLYLGEVEDATQPLGIHGLVEEGEEIQAAWVPLDEALRLVDAGKIQDAKTLIGLSLLERRLRAMPIGQPTPKGE
ncbi:MAG: NUDIX domain-containing protein [Acidimicrobiia bacterium]|nr:NUDIX domain-containing protein [Acidimicrobiia bacterium]